MKTTDYFNKTTNMTLAPFLTKELWRDWPELSNFERSFGMQERPFRPHIDVVQKENQIMIMAELPGMDKNDIKVNLIEGHLELSGKKEISRENKDSTYHHLERRSGEFFRRIPLPEGTDQSKIKAKFDNGLLEIICPMPPEKQPHQVPINVE